MRRCLLALGAAAAALSFMPAHANLLTNGSFEARVVTAADSCQGFAWCVRSGDSTPGWTQELDGVDLIHNNYLQGPAVLVDAADGVNFLDMNQGGQFGGISQVVGVTPGQSYTLMLQSTAWATNALGGRIRYTLFDGVTNDVLAQSNFDDTLGGLWVPLSLQANATSSLMGVRIVQTATFQAGLGVDNVVLVATPVPEPAAAVLLLAGLAGLSAAARRRATPAH